MEWSDMEGSHQARIVMPAHEPGAPCKEDYDLHMITHTPCSWSVGASPGADAPRNTDT